MKRNRRWLLLLTAIIVFIVDTDALKATSLIFGRSPNKTSTTATTTTTTSTVSPAEADSIKLDEATNIENADEEQDEDEVTKPPLTGIPQIDYVWDPNLPRELNGYNLSSYPFLNSVPEGEDIDFKCDGLHDGFYASIKYSCQLYHHCIYGIRHDFLCANFTAFDQKTFICHFASEVNCKGSAKYWFRNDALYKATTTTSTTTTTPAPPPTTTTQEPPRRPAPRRPLRNRRPQHEYYYDDEDYQDDYVEERRRRPGRQRNRRPEYDEYESRGYRDDEDDYSYEQRSSHRPRTRDNVDEDFEYDHRPMMDRPRNRNRPNENRRHNDNDRRGVDDRKYEYEDRKTHHEGRLGLENDKRKMKDRRPLMNDDRRPINDERRESADERRSSHDDRRPFNEDRKSMLEDRHSAYDDKKEDDKYEERRGNSDARRPLADSRRPISNERRIENRRPPNERRRINGERRPPTIDDEYDQPRKYPDPDEEKEDIQKPEIVPKVRASGSAGPSIFNKPRAPPKISRPVPLTERKKFEYTPQKLGKTGSVAAAVPSAAADEEVYDDDYDYETEPEKSQPASKEEKTDNKNPLYASSQGNRTPLNYRHELPSDKLGPYETEKANDENLEANGRMTFKPQRSAGQKSDPNQQHHGTSQDSDTRFTNSGKTSTSNKSAVDYTREILSPETDVKEKEEEQQEEEEEDEEEDVYAKNVNTHLKSTDLGPRDAQRNAYRTDIRGSSEMVLDSFIEYKPVSHDDVPLRVLPADSEKPNSEIHLTNQYKNKPHRLAPTPNVQTSYSDTTDLSKTSNIESEEKDVYKGSIIPASEIRPSGFKSAGQDASSFYDTETDLVRNNRPYVRIMKRPFLPSRGGSPYLPRGLKPLGGGTSVNVNTEYSTGNTPIDMGSSTISGTRLLEHSPPIIRTNFQNDISQVQSGPRTTQQPQIESPRSPLDEIYNSDYDVTLNDALNPTLKPITQSHNRESSIGYASGKYDRNNPYARSDVSYSPSQYRSTAIQPPAHVQARTSQRNPPQTQQQYYDEEYEY